MQAINETHGLHRAGRLEEALEARRGFEEHPIDGLADSLPRCAGPKQRVPRLLHLLRNGRRQLQLFEDLVVDVGGTVQAGDAACDAILARALLALLALGDPLLDHLLVLLEVGLLVGMLFHRHGSGAAPTPAHARCWASSVPLEAPLGQKWPRAPATVDLRQKAAIGKHFCLA